MRAVLLGYYINCKRHVNIWRASHQWIILRNATRIVRVSTSGWILQVWIWRKIWMLLWGIEPMPFRDHIYAMTDWTTVASQRHRNFSYIFTRIYFCPLYQFLPSLTFTHAYTPEYTCSFIQDAHSVVYWALILYRLFHGGTYYLV